MTTANTSPSSGPCPTTTRRPAFLAPLPFPCQSVHLSSSSSSFLSPSLRTSTTRPSRLIYMTQQAPVPSYPPSSSPPAMPTNTSIDPSVLTATASEVTRVVPAAAFRGRTPQIPDLATYKALHAQSLNDPEGFWRPILDTFHWHTPPPPASSSALFDSNFDVTSGSPISVKFADGGVTNICYNAVDRWADDPTTCNRVAFYCEPNHPDTPATSVTYGELRNMVARFAVVLRDLGVQKGDPVVLYMPMVVELPAAMLACARIGAVHSVVFGGFSADALAGRILDSRARVVVSAHSVGRGLKTIPLKQIMDNAIDIVTAARAPASSSQDNGGEEFFKVRHHIVVRADHSQPAQDLQLSGGIDIDWDDACNAVSKTVAAESPVEWVPAEHPLFILYTSGSTGKPKGVVHSTAGYMTYAATTFKYVFDYDAAHGDVFFSTSDCGWITGHTYVTYGPLLNGASQVLYEGVPTFPDAGRLWAVCEKYGVSQLYTAPTVIRALKGAAPPPAESPASEGGKDVSSTPSSDQWVTSHDLSKLRILGTVGEPINPEAWIWYFDVVGGGNCAIVDTWWQTETGGHCLTPLPIPGLELKPGSAMLPFFGVEPALLDASGAELQASGDGETQGYLVLKRPWPSTLRSVYGDHARMEQTYFARFPGFYMTGDGARRDSDGHYWLTGRVDDLLNVSGHRIGTAEVEAAIVMHSKVGESAVVAVDHPVKGQSIYAYVTLLPQHTGVLGSEMDEAKMKKKSELKKEIVEVVRKQIGPFAKPDVIHWAPALPKTRSGKIMRRILRKIAADGKKTDIAGLGDTSTLTDPGVVDALLATHGL